MLRKRYKEMTEDQISDMVAQEKLEVCNSVCSTDSFKYLRLLLHLFGSVQFTYAIYFHWFNVNWPILPGEIELQARWGGKFKYLTFLNAILQAIYYTVALLNDVFGTNAVYPRKPSFLRKFRDFIFAAFAFPVAHNVCILFWAIYVIDRELIFPSELDEIFLSWLNQVVHTNISIMGILDVFVCFRRYPKRAAGIAGTSIFMILYIIWVHIVRYFSGEWVYPIMEILNIPLRFVLLGGLFGFTIICYLLGEYINELAWRQELQLLRQWGK